MTTLRAKAQKRQTEESATFAQVVWDCLRRDPKTLEAVGEWRQCSEVGGLQGKLRDLESGGSVASEFFTRFKGDYWRTSKGRKVIKAMPTPLRSYRVPVLLLVSFPLEQRWHSISADGLKARWESLLGDARGCYKLVLPKERAADPEARLLAQAKAEWDQDDAVVLKIYYAFSLRFDSREIFLKEMERIADDVGMLPKQRADIGPSFLPQLRFSVKHAASYLAELSAYDVLKETAQKDGISLKSAIAEGLGLPLIPAGTSQRDVNRIQARMSRTRRLCDQLAGYLAGRIHSVPSPMSRKTPATSASSP